MMVNLDVDIALGWQWRVLSDQITMHALSFRIYPMDEKPSITFPPESESLWHM